MRRFWKFAFFTCVWLAAGTGVLRAQSGDDGKNEFSFWGGGSFASSSLIGNVPETRLGIFALRYGRALVRSENYALSYTVDAVPTAILSFPQVRSGLTVRTITAGRGSVDVFVPTATRIQRTAVGAGVAPIGLHFDFQRKKRIVPFVEGTGGFLYFSKIVPDNGTKFNFTYDFGGGVRIRAGESRAVTLGYKYYHISNAERGGVNPGFDSNLIYAGFSFFK
jgi:opacity protein-like surface antigen